jgi:hypothetical protein
MTDVATSNSLTDLRERLKNEYAAVVHSLKASVSHAMAAGDLLFEAKAQLNHGQWLPWLESCGISERTAQRCMRLARNRTVIEAKSDTLVTDVSITGALGMLAAPRSSNDEIARDAARLADHAIDVAFDLPVLEDAEAERDRRHALLAEAKAAVEKIGALAEHQPALAAMIEVLPKLSS